MHRILIDLTDLEHWTGSHGGIQRVVYGISKNFYLSNSKDVHFISFDAQTKQFYSSDFKPIYERVDTTESPQELTKVTTSANKSIGSFLAASVKRNTIIRKVAGKPKIQDTSPHSPKPSPVVFHASDTVLVMGKPWDNLDIQNTLSKQKEKFGFRLVQVVYDMVICLYPHLQNPVLIEPYTKHMRSVVASSDLLLAISKSTANDLKVFCEQQQLTPPKIEVIRLGDDIADNVPKPKDKPSTVINKEFIVCVGTVEIRKNHALLYYAYKLAQGRGIDLPQLVIAGSEGWLTGDIQYMIKNDPAMKNKIVVLHDVNDQGLAWLYQNCLFSVYPSMYEGWGLPIAESLNYGKMCISSNTSSMPEIAGDLIDYFSPFNSEECLEKIQAYLNKKKLKYKEQEITNRYNQTLWKDTFKQILGSLS